MAPVRSSLLIIVLVLGGCSGETDDPGSKKLTGSPVAVAKLPRYHGTGRFKVESCCTLLFGPDARPEQVQGIDSIIHDVSGPGYVLHIVFGPYDASPPQPGYRPEGKRAIDGVILTGFRWPDLNRKPPEGRLLWLAQVGGGRIDGVNHTPWGLRIMGDCGTPVACRASADLVGTIRF